MFCGKLNRKLTAKICYYVYDKGQHLTGGECRTLYTHLRKKSNAKNKQRVKDYVCNTAAEHTEH